MNAAGLSRRFARSAVRHIAFLLIAAFGALTRWLRRPGPYDPNADVQRILIIRLDLLGDVLFSMPLVQGLRARFPHAYIAMLTLPYTAPLVAGFAQVDDAVAVDTNRIRSVRTLVSATTWLQYYRTWRYLRQQRFDLCVSVTGRMASLCAALAGARRSVGYGGDSYPFLLTDELPGKRYGERKHEVEYVRRLAIHAGARDVPRRLVAPVTDAARRRVRKLLQEHGVPADRPVVLIHAGSVNGSAKRWPAAYWGRFADELHIATGASVLLIGAASDRPVAVEVQTGAVHHVYSVVGDTDIPELSALIERADLLATGDSGPLHLGVALGTPLVAVYGPTDPAVYGPYSPRGPVRVHRSDIACSPCYSLAATAECPLGNPICMELVGVDEMVASAVELLAPKSLAPR